MLCKIVRGTNVPGNEKSRERKFPVVTIRSLERKVLGTKSPGTEEFATSHTRQQFAIEYFQTEAENVALHRPARAAVAFLFDRMRNSEYCCCLQIALIKPTILLLLIDWVSKLRFTFTLRIRFSS